MPLAPSWNAGSTTATGQSFADGSDAYANSGYVISFEHLPSANAVFFKAFITAFNETFTSDWSGESVYGRADPIYMFKQTKRDINLAFKIPAATQAEAFQNLSSVQLLTQFLYPSYRNPDQADTITQSPLIRLKIMNFVKTSVSNASTGDVGEYSNTSGGTDSSYGLLGAIKSIAIDHSLAAQDGVVELGGGAVLSKIIEVNLNFSAIHEHSLGWSTSGFSKPAFPYGANKFGAAEDAPSTGGGTAGTGGGTGQTASEQDAMADVSDIVLGSTTEEICRANPEQCEIDAATGEAVGLVDPLE